MNKINHLITAVAFFFCCIVPVPGFAFNVNVVQGNASVSSNGSTITITATGRAILQGNTSIPVGTTVKVVQGANDILLRDSTGNITNILGSLLSNGNIILINTMGVYIGQSANINVGGLMASTLDIKNQLFMNGTYQFEKVPGLDPAEILNEAKITVAPGGYVVLLSDRVVNKGTITAYMGSVALGSGQQATVSLDQGGLINLVINQGLAQQLTGKNGKTKAQIVNSGRINANGGKVQLTAQLLEATLSQVVNNTGNIQANKVVNEGGFLDLTANGAIDNSGTIQAGTLKEQGETFHSIGTLDVGKSYFDNLDGAIDISGDISGTISDADDIDLVGAVTLMADTTLQADSGATGTQGEIVMNGNSLVGGGFNLTLTAGLNDILDGSITGVNLLSLNSSTASPVTFTSTAASGGFSVISLLTNDPASFSRNETDGSGNQLIFSDSDAVGGLAFIGTNTTTLGEKYVLANNIDASDTSTTGFTPIGNSGTPFTGTFNGNNHTISDLTIDLPSTNDVGLFGESSGATITNTGLLSASITGLDAVGGLLGDEGNSSSISNSYVTGSVSGSAQVGGLVGDANASTITTSYSGSTVSGANSSSQVGGLVGINDASSSITNSYATGNVTQGTSSSQGGGLVGKNNSSSISNSYATGNVNGVAQVGGLVGNNTGTILNSFATGAPVGASSTGGLAGSSSGTITNSYYSNSSHENGLGIYDSNGASDFFKTSNAVYSGGTPWDFTNTWVAAGSMYPLLLVSFDIWSGSGNWSNPANWSHFAVPTSTSNVLFNATSLNASIIDSAFGGDIGNLLIGSAYNGTITQNANLSISGSFIKSGGTYAAAGSTTTFTGSGIITSGSSSFDNVTIDATGTYTLTDGMAAAGNFTQTAGTFVADPTQTTFSVGDSFFLQGGTFNRFTGEGTTETPYLVYDLYGLQGMAGYLSDSLELANNINASATSNWNSSAGFLPVGNSSTPFTGSFSGNNYTISGLFINSPSSSYVGLFGYTSGASLENTGMTSVNITGLNNVGSLVGFNNSGSIVNNYTTGAVSGNNSVGGLAGYNYGGTIINSYATDTVTGSGNDIGGLAGANGNSGIINNSYASGQVNGVSEVGGLVGSNDTGSSISFSDALGSVTGTGNDIGGLVGSATNSSSISYSFSSGNVSGAADVGGLVGDNDTSNISNAYATGTVTASGNAVGGLIGSNNTSAILNSFASGLVTGVTDIGGFAGDDVGGSTYTVNFFDDTVNALLTGTGGGNVSGISGETTGSMQTASIFKTAATGWDFNGLWASPSGSSYPSFVWQGMHNLSFIGGTSSTPFLINNVDQLQFMEYELGDDYNLNANFDASVTSTWNAGQGFVPVGSSGTPFTGNFNGDNFQIINLFIDRPSTNDVGLFGYVYNVNSDNLSTIENMLLTNASITGQNNVGAVVGYSHLFDISYVSVSGSVSGISDVGGLAGYADSDQLNGDYGIGAVNGVAEVGGMIGYSTSAIIADNYATGNVTGSGADVGGFLGYGISNAFSDNYALGHVTGSANNVGGLIGNNNLSDVSYSDATGNVSGVSDVGGLIGNNNSSNISYSYATGNVNGSSTGSETGGLVGSNNSSNITLSYATGNVSGGSDVGGLSGYNSSGSTITNTYAQGSVSGNGTGNSIGGLIGNNSSAVSNSYASGLVTGVSDLGGLIGSDNTGSYTANFFDDTVNSLLAGTGNNGNVSGISGASTANMQTNTIFAAANWDYDYLWMNAATAYPIFIWQGMNNGRFIGSTAFNPFLINNVNQLQFMGYDLDADYRLASNIDASATSTWNSGAGFIPVGDSATPFIGKLNGNYFTISNLFIDRPSTDDVGLFGEMSELKLQNPGLVYNLGLLNANITGQNNVGGLIGYDVAGYASYSYVTGSVSGTGNDVGGVIGQSVYSTNGIYASASVTGGSNVGGLIGDDSDSITDSYATGNVSGTSNVGGLVGTNSSFVSDSYATGNASGTSNVGGLVGDNTGAISASFSTGNASGTSNVGGLAGSSSGSIINSYYTDAGEQNSLGTYDANGPSDFFSASNAVYNGSNPWDFTDTWVAMTITDPLPLFTFDVWEGSGNWSSVFNWSRGAVPTSSSNVLFNSDSTNNSTVDASFAGDINNLVIQAGYTASITQNSPLTLSANYIQMGGGFNQNANLSIGADFYKSGGVFNASSQPVTFTGAGTITTGGSSFGSLTVDAAGTYTLENALTVDNNLIIQAGALDTGSNTITFDGNGLDLLDAGGSSFYNIIHLGTGTLQLTANPLTVTNNFTNSAGTFDLNGQDWTMTGAGFSNNNGVLKLEGSEIITGLTMDTAFGSVTYDGTSIYTGLALGNNYNNLNFNGTGGTWYLTAPLTVNGALGVQAGTLNANGQTNTVTSLTTLSGGTYQTSTNSQNLNGGLTVSGGTLTGSSGTVSTSNMTLSSGTIDLTNGPLDVSLNWIQNGGTFTPGSGPVVFDGTSTISGSSTPVFNNITITGSLTAPGSMDVAGDWINSGAFNANAGTVVFNSSALQTLDAGSSDFYNITHSGTGTLQLTASPLTVTHDLTNATGTFDLNGQGWTMTGASFINNNGALQLQGGETVTGLNMTAQGTVIYDGTSTYSDLDLGNTYDNLTFNGTGGVWDLSAPLTVNGNLNLLNGTLTAPPTIDLSGNWSNAGGVFNANNGNVILDGGNQQISGDSTFYNLTKINGGSDILSFNAGDTQTVTGVLDLAGTNEYQQLALRSTMTGTTWLLDLEGGINLNYLNVKDSQASGTLAACSLDCTDSGNNTGWFIKKFYFPVIIPPTNFLQLQQQDMSRQGINATPLLGQAKFGNDEDIEAYWIPYGDKYETNGLDESMWNSWGADIAVKGPWGVELLSK